jgi:transmembrane sensor
MKENDLEKLLNLYIKGKCSPEEKQKLESWFDRLSSDGKLESNTFDKQVQMQKIKNKIDNQIRQDRVIKFPAMLRIAASVILIASVSIFAYKSTWLRDLIDPVQFVTTTVQNGQKMKLTLSDGSTVILNSGSKIQYPKEFSRQIRKVTLLEGEAFFDIQHNKEKPFVVETRGTQTQVLGTAFNVQAYKGFKHVKVTVTRGKVAVKETKSGKQRLVFLLPNQQVVVNTITGNQEKKQIDANESIDWIQDKLQFKNQSLVNVALILQDNYNVKIEFKEETIKGIRFTANFHSTDSLEKILFAIAKANKLTYSLKGKTVLFKYKNHFTKKPEIIMN